MLTYKAILSNRYKSADYTNPQTGVTTKGRHKLQLLVERPLKNGGIKKELIDISIPEEKASKYIGMEGKQIEVDVSYFGQCTFFGI